MFCCCGQESTVVQVLPDSPVPTTPQRKKRPRDVFFLLSFVAMLAGMVYLARFSVQNGDIGRYMYGVDSWGNVCGRSVNAPIPNANKSGVDHSTRPYEFQMILSDIKMALNPVDILLKKNAPATICVKQCPAELTNCRRLLLDNGYHLNDSVISERVCTMPLGVILPHHPLINRCIPSHLIQLVSVLADSAIKASDPELAAQHLLQNATKPPSNDTGLQALVSLVAGQIINSTIKYWKDTVYLCLVALGVSLAMIVLLQFFSRVVVVAIVVVAGLGTLSLTGFLWYNYAVVIGAVNETTVESMLHSSLAMTTFSASSPNQSVPANITAFNAGTLLDMLSFSALRESNYLLPASIVVTIVTIIVLLLLIWSRKSFCLVANLFDEASLSVFNMPGMLLQPFITLIVMIAATAYFFVIGAYIFAIRMPIVDGHGMVQFVEDPLTPRVPLALPHLAGWLWIMQFFSGCQQVILAGAVSRWFFTKGEKRKKCACNIFSSCRATSDLILYSLGSVALGSLIIAIVQFIRIVLFYLQRKLKNSNNKAAVYIMKCISCCLACFEKVLKYITRNAYICIAMYGDGFCAGAKHAFSLLMNNVQHVTALNCISGFCLFLGKFAVVIITGFSGYCWFRNKLGLAAPQAEFIVPVTIACFVSFVISACFLNVYEMAIDTIFLCFCDDQQRNDGCDRPYYSSVKLQRYMSGSVKGKKKKNKVEATRTAVKAPGTNQRANVPPISQRRQPEASEALAPRVVLELHESESRDTSVSTDSDDVSLDDSSITDDFDTYICKLLGEREKSPLSKRSKLDPDRTPEERRRRTTPFPPICDECESAYMSESRTRSPVPGHDPYELEEKATNGQLFLQQLWPPLQQPPLLPSSPDVVDTIFHTESEISITLPHDVSSTNSSHTIDESKPCCSFQNVRGEKATAFFSESNKCHPLTKFSFFL